MLHFRFAALACAALAALAPPAGAADVSLPPGQKAVTPAPPPAFVRPKAVESGNRAKKVGDELECLLEPRLVVNVGSPVEGTLSKVLVDRGSVVSAGQVVAQLNSNVETATVDLKRAQEDFGKRKVERNEELYKKDLISAMDRDELATQARIAALERRQQEEVLAQRTIRSPINGVVVERYLAPGDRVQQDKIVRLAQVNPLNVEVVAPVEMFGSIRVGMTGVVSLDPLVKGRYQARVVIVDRVVDAASGTFGVRLELPNPSNLIPAGIKCGVTIKP